MPNDDVHEKHMLDAAQNASRDADGLVAKIATAGITAVVAVAALAETAPDKLVFAGFFFASSLIAALLSIRISADAIAWDAEHESRPAFWYGVVKFLNYVAVSLLIVAVVLVALSVSAVAIPEPAST